MENVRSYPLVKERIAQGTLSIHGWWFDIAQADVYHYDSYLNRFILIDETEANKMLQEPETFYGQ